MCYLLSGIQGLSKATKNVTSLYFYIEKDFILSTDILSGDRHLSNVHHQYMLLSARHLLNLHFIWKLLLLNVHFKVFLQTNHYINIPNLKIIGIDLKAVSVQV